MCGIAKLYCVLSRAIHSTRTHVMNIVIRIGNRYRFPFGIIYKHIELKRSDAYFRYKMWEIFLQFLASIFKTINKININYLDRIRTV